MLYVLLFLNMWMDPQRFWIEFVIRNINIKAASSFQFKYWDDTDFVVVGLFRELYIFPWSPNALTC